MAFSLRSGPGWQVLKGSKWQADVLEQPH